MNRKLRSSEQAPGLSFGSAVPDVLWARLPVHLHITQELRFAVLVRTSSCSKRTLSFLIEFVRQHLHPPGRLVASSWERAEVVIVNCSAASEGLASFSRANGLLFQQLQVASVPFDAVP